ncbi:MAG: PEP-CTERM sorting domain-containing protein [Verrucomicrobia bacterium]|nr:PEP-CTERM sorting domain-containing protein [Verrucomicrobiota bacterium]
MKKLTLSLSLLTFSCAAVSAQSLSTNFNSSPVVGTTSLAHTDALTPDNNGTRGVAFTNINWTTSGSLGLTGLTGALTMGNYTWSGIGSGQIFTTLADGAWRIGTSGDTGNARATGTTIDGNANIQFGSGTVANANNVTEAARIGTFNLLFTVSGVLNNPQLDFRAGTSQTNGAWHNNTAVQNGDVSVNIVPVILNGNNGTADFVNSVSLGTQAIGAGSGNVMTFVGNQSLAAGTYLLQISFSNKGRNERASIDDLTMIPEPSTYAALFGLLALGFVAWRRRK